MKWHVGGMPQEQSSMCSYFSNSVCIIAVAAPWPKQVTYQTWKKCEGDSRTQTKYLAHFFQIHQCLPSPLHAYSLPSQPFVPFLFSPQLLAPVLVDLVVSVQLFISCSLLISSLSGLFRLALFTSHGVDFSPQHSYSPSLSHSPISMDSLSCIMSKYPVLNKGTTEMSGKDHQPNGSLPLAFGAGQRKGDKLTSF